jgi:SAM-dependent methyltransferase
MGRFFGIFKALNELNVPGIEVTDAFAGLPASFYNGLADQVDQDLLWFLSRVPQAGASVLDLCCGGGRALAVFARAGHHSTGVDLSPDMLAQAARRLAGEDPGVRARIELVRGDALALRLDRAFDCVVLAGLGLTLFLSSAQRRALFATVRHHLRPGGRLLFDYSPGTRDEPRGTSISSFPLRTGGEEGFVLVGHERVPAEGYQLTNVYGELIAPGGATRRFLSSVEFSVLDPVALGAELAAAGLAVREAYDMPLPPADGQDLTANQRMVLAERTD